ncbi:proteasome accessory factor A [Austwickia chelonae]|uniref:Putative Pup deamidase n=1 Tax=Austwickia chelonae NBRC 105200 TaxID=1184607 RepID=K6VKA4_9MICO|nr:depupylase/deamidase Dop [Austwickia chelonae]GAB77154.1 putative Pup deamidase [Austwickia chelonae NBRC 105200]SEW04004.1 proteasome accessory factor A [Austwickia chelonae]
MTVRRIMGTETEYGITVPGHPDANPMIASGRIVQAYAQDHGHHHLDHHWDYTGETPLTDARGWTTPRRHAHPSQLTDDWADDPTVANVVLTNGARLYVDHAHPEYSAPETTTPRDTLLWERAGELVMARAAELVARPAPVDAHPSDPRHGPAINLYKNNTDGKGASYGFHENYLVTRDTPFERIVSDLTPFFVSRPVICGAGRVGLGPRSQTPGYQISARADFFENRVGLETTFRRPIINTRDEPHADPRRYRRLHVIVGDATFAEVAGLLKTGTTSLVLDLIEHGGLTRLGLDPAAITPTDPVAAMHTISHDPTLHATVRTETGTTLTGLQLQWTYLELVHRHLAATVGDDLDPDTAEVLLRWEDVLTRLENDPASAAAHIDWVAKWTLLERYRSRDGLDWDAPLLSAIDIQWSDLRPGRGLARRLEERGSLERLTDPTLVQQATTCPPPDTRAWFRGECLRRYPRHVIAASWDSIVFDVPGRPALQRVDTLDPTRGTRERTHALLERCPDADTLLNELTTNT